MAVKKPIKKRDTSNPNTALVLFLVFFVLLSIGLGVWGYYGYSGQQNLKKDALDKQKDKEAAKVGEEYAQWQALELRSAAGLDMTLDERNLLDQRRKEDRFKGEPTYATVEAYLKETRRLVGGDDATKTYTSSFKKKLTELQDENLKLQGDFAKAKKDYLAERDNYLKLEARLDNYWKTAIKTIQKGNDLALQEAAKQPDRMEEAQKQIKGLQTEVETLQENRRQEKSKLEAEKRILLDQFAELKRKLETTTPLQATRAALVEPHALLLDISPGRALWDEPLGKITRVDLREMQVYINIGSARGVRPELTFNIFGPGWHGRADKGLKGTIEVQRVVDANSAVARITGLYDADGFEISFNDPNRLRRESENPIKEGDLLFNMAWGSHVVVAGPVNWTGLPGESGNDHTRHLRAFISLLQRQGIAVDAYIDLTSGELKGAIMPDTRFMIRGESLPVDKEGKPEANRRINEAVQAVRKEAIERGMFIISADNFATVIGYHRPRQADSDMPAFRATVPYAGSPVAPRVSAPAPDAPGAEPPMEKEKGKEKVEKEKVEKDKN